MLETFEVKKPFYPLISFSVSVIVLIFGMLFSKNLLAFAFATAIFVLYSVFGLFKSTWKMTVAMAICGLIIGGLSFLTNTFKNDSLGIVCRADGKHIALRSNTLSCKAEMPESYNARHACNT